MGLLLHVNRNGCRGKSNGTICPLLLRTTMLVSPWKSFSSVSTSNCFLSQWLGDACHVWCETLLLIIDILSQVIDFLACFLGIFWSHVDLLSFHVWCKYVYICGVDFANSMCSWVPFAKIPPCQWFGYSSYLLFHQQNKQIASHLPKYKQSVSYPTST